jgi:hypothetical protein
MRSPATLAPLRARLVTRAAPLFATGAHVRALESAYQRMWEHHRAGLPPADFDVPADA